MFDITFGEIIFWVILCWIYNVSLISENNMIKKSLKIAHDKNNDLKAQVRFAKDQVRELMIEKGRK